MCAFRVFIIGGIFVIEKEPQVQSGWNPAPESRNKDTVLVDSCISKRCHLGCLKKDFGVKSAGSRMLSKVIFPNLSSLSTEISSESLINESDCL